MECMCTVCLENNFILSCRFVIIPVMKPPLNSKKADTIAGFERC